MKIYFVRHSEVIEPYQGCYNGHIDIPLSQKGKEDAKKLAQHLGSIPFEKVFCSDLRRCKETLEAFMPLKAHVVYTPRLREKSWGRHEGKRFEEIEAEGIVYESFSQWINALDGEDVSHYMNRLWEYFQDEILTQKARNILVVTHAGVIKSLIARHEGMGLDETFGIALPYSGYVVYDKKDGFML